MKNNQDLKLRQPNLLGIDPRILAGTKDHYETTMADTLVVADDCRRKSTFNVAVRGLRDHKVVGKRTLEIEGAKFEAFQIEQDNYLMVAGIEQAIAGILAYETSDELLSMLERKGIASETITELDSNKKLDLDVYGIPEGVPVFGNEPMLSVNGTFEQAQFPETIILSQLGYQTAVATTASYIRNMLVEFGREDMLTLEGGSRRCIFPLAASRAALIGGFKGTSLEQLALEYPELENVVGGSAGHSAVLHAGGDKEAFEKQLRSYFEIKNNDSQQTIDEKIKSGEQKKPGPTFLLDTFDSTEGLEVAISLIEKYGLSKAAVRTDSGDPLERSNYMRGRLDELGLDFVKIMVSDDLTGYKVHELLEAKAPIDILLMGTYLVNPYKLPGPVHKAARDEQVDGSVIDVCKIVKNNPAKATLPGRLEVYRVISKKDCKADRDLILMAGENVCDYLTDDDSEALKLTTQFVEGGKQVYDFPTMTQIQQTREYHLGLMREEHMRFKGAIPYKVIVSEKIKSAQQKYSQKMFGEKT